MTVFAAAYESASKAEAAAKKGGWSKGDDSFLDYIDPLDGKLKERKRFEGQEAAVDWLKAEIMADKSLFGAGDIMAMEFVPHHKRCQYCICDGWRDVRRMVVTNDGIESDEAAENYCHNDE